VYDENEALPTVEIAFSARLKFVNIEIAFVPPLLQQFTKPKSFLVHVLWNPLKTCKPLGSRYLPASRCASR
jgi:hypothetical protein